MNHIITATAPDSLDEPQVLHLALVGLGAQGQEHLQAARLARHVRFVAGIDSSEPARAMTARQHPQLGMALFDSLKALQQAIQDGLRVDALVLALPHHTYDLEWPAITAFGLPLLKEKPLARDQDEARSFLDQARRSGCVVQTAIQRRHHPSYAFLRQQLVEQHEQVLEVHAHMHLGFAAPTPAGTPDQTTWRNDPSRSGGGTLLDSGYHMVDLLHFLVGPFELVSATLLKHGKPIEGRNDEDRVWLNGRSEHTWIGLDSWLHGQPDPDGPAGRFLKSEGVTLHTARHLWHADRTGVQCDGVDVFRTEREWLKAMAEQLDAFAGRISRNEWHDPTLWDQLPAMRIIDQAYQQARAF